MGPDEGGIPWPAKMRRLQFSHHLAISQFKGILSPELVRTWWNKQASSSEQQKGRNLLQSLLKSLQCAEIRGGGQAHNNRCHNTKNLELKLYF